MIASERPSTPQQVFTRLAARYDSLNTVASLGRDRVWRSEAAARLSGESVSAILDLCCGTGAMGAELRRRFPRARIIGVDLNTAMVSVARKKRGHCYDGLLNATVEAIPLAADAVDVVVLALGFHDLGDPTAALEEVARVLRPGGEFLMLELTLPDSPWRRRLYLRALSLLIRIREFLRLRSSGHVLDEIRMSPPHEFVTARLEAAGFRRCDRRPHGAGLMTSYLTRRIPCAKTPGSGEVPDV